MKFRRRYLEGKFFQRVKFWGSVEEVKGIEGRLQMFRKRNDHNSEAIFSKESD